MSYVDLADPENQTRYPELLATIQEQNLPYPLVVINDHLMLAGSAHYYQVLPLVEEILQPQEVAQ